jgi:DNA-binding transcriptional LysR family regulator
MPASASPTAAGPSNVRDSASNVRRLRVLRELTARGTIAATAEALGYTAPAVSQQLAALEREAGVALLEKNGRRRRLTPAGEELVVRIEGILRELEAACDRDVKALTER